MTDKQPLSIQQIVNKVRKVSSGSSGNDHLFRTPDDLCASEDCATDIRPSFFQGAFLDVDRSVFDLKELLDFHDRTFVINVYRAMLKRDPDPDGFDHYLDMLRSGTMHKVRILASFRDSAEGRKQNVKVRGLSWAVFTLKVKNLPLLGETAAYLLALFGLRRIRADLDQKEIELGRLFEETGQALARLEARVESRLDAKADKNQLAQKADLGEMDQYLRTVNHILDMVCSLHDPDSSGVDAYAAPWTDDLYLSFEDAFRGTRESIKARLSVYLPEVQTAVEKSAPVLERAHAGPDCRVVDLGCGRGEFLEMMAENGISAMGIDSNRIMTQQGRDTGLNIREEDIFSFLKNLPPECMAAVTAFQVLEHLPFPRQLLLIDQCRRILSPGGLLILETPNPQNLLAGSVDFYRDPTHIKPVHPDTLRFLARARGFSRARICYPLQTEEGMRLADAEGTQFEDLSDYITVARDYALLAYKA
jgi:2-polyprenyl-3-methyl-5-hydroxy-6-metoxy-1,4-benzoquinol methylase